MLTTVVLLSLALFVSIGANIFLIWFVWKSLRQIAEYDEELRDGTRGSVTRHQLDL